MNNNRFSTIKFLVKPFYKKVLPEAFAKYIIRSKLKY
jgi:hypothetical protein